MRIYVKVIPKSSRNKIEKTGEREYKVWLTAPPVDGKANSMLIQVLSDYFDISKSSLAIIGGKTARTKIIERRIYMKKIEYNGKEMPLIDLEAEEMPSCPVCSSKSSEVKIIEGASNIMVTLQKCTNIFCKEMFVARWSSC